MNSIPYVPRRGKTAKELRRLGWTRSRRQRRSKQPEVWKARAWWRPTGENIERELVVRILRIEGGQFQVQVRRLRSEEGARGHVLSSVYWQPVPAYTVPCPLALAVMLHIDGAGDPVRAAYTEAKGCRYEVNWIPAPRHPPVQHRGLAPAGDTTQDAMAYAQAQVDAYRREFPRMAAGWQHAAVTPKIGGDQ